MAVMLQIHELSCGYRGQAVVEGLSFCLTPGEILCLLGPNGVGKTTLFKTILNLQPRLGGEIRVDGSDIAAWTPARRGRTIAYVPQAHIPPFPFTVLQVATMGFAARLGAFGRPGSTEQRAAAAILERLGIGHLADRVYTEISGGERQMVLIARALVQEPRILILDEPTSNLDFGNQVRVLALINSLASQGMAVLMTTHFPNHVFLCSTGVILMGPGRRVRAGTLDAVVTEANLEQAYGIRVRLARIDLEDGLSVRTCLPLMGSEPRMYAGNR